MKTKKRKFLSCILGAAIAAIIVLASPAGVYAVPANPFAFVFQQADDSEIMLNFRGDEFFAWWEDENGFVVAFDADSGNWRYAYVVEGIISPVGQPVGSFDQGGAEFGRIGRGVILPLIAGGWRFDPGDPMVEFLNGQVLADHRPVAVPIPTPAPAAIENPIINIAPIQPGQPVTPPTMPTIPSIMRPPTPGGTPAPGQPPVQPPATPPPSEGNGDGIIIGSLGSGFHAAFNEPAAPLFSAAGGSNSAEHIQTNQRLLVLLIEFEDMPMLRDSEFYHNKYFNTTPGAISIANYFSDMSGGYNIFVPAGQVAGGGTFNTGFVEGDTSWAQEGVDVTITPSVHNGIVNVKLHMSHPISEWGVPVGHQSVRDAISVALAAIAQNTNFDFDGVHVSAIFAGGEASDNYNPGGQIWGHAWQFRGSAVGQQGWLRYAAYGERQRGGHIVGIGIATHELGHVMGLPDLYDLTGQSEGIGPYSLMAFGSWGRGPQDAAVGHRPTAFDPWSLIQLGYARPTIISSGTWRGNVNSLNTDNYNILMLTSPAGPTQYFLIENRQMESTWDAGLSQWITDPTNPGGIMIFHVDDSLRSANPADMTRNNNNRHHPMVDVREADGSGLLNSSVVNWGAKQDHFFTGDNFNQFGGDTNPSSHFFSGTGAAGSRNVETGIEMILHSPRGDVMEIEITLSQSGGISAPMIGVDGAGGSAAAAPAAPSTQPPASAELNHSRIRNQLLISDDAPALTLGQGASQILLLAATLDLLVEQMSPLTIVTATHSIVFPDALLAELGAAGNEIVITIVGSNVSMAADGQVLTNLRNIHHVFENR